MASDIDSAGDTTVIESNELAGLFAHLTRYDRVFLAVSGGLDSTALMQLVADWLEAASDFIDHTRKLQVLTVNHGLRPEAARETEAVVAAATERGLPAEILNWKGEIPQTGIQQAARDIRYGLLIDRLRVERTSGRSVALVTAHHRNDLAETLLMRLARGAGVDGLAAMQPVTERDGIDIVRPLLGVPKTRLRATLEARNITWQEDPSNQDCKFERVRLREAAQLLQDAGLSDAALARTAKRMARARRALEGIADQLLVSHLADPLLLRCGVFTWPWGRTEIADEIAIRVLLRVLPAIGGSNGVMRLARVERLYEDIQRDDFAGATLANCVVTGRKSAIGAHNVQIFREPNRSELPEISSKLETAVIWDNRFRISRPSADEKIFKIRGLKSADLRMFDFGAMSGKLTCPIEALAATPVLEDSDGGLAIPALDVHLTPANVESATTIDCQFIVERIGSR